MQYNTAIPYNTTYNLQAIQYKQYHAMQAMQYLQYKLHRTIQQYNAIDTIGYNASNSLYYSNMNITVPTVKLF